MDSIKEFFDTVYTEGVDLDALDAIHKITKDIVHNEGNDLCQAFETWYAEKVYSDDDD